MDEAGAAPTPRNRERVCSAAADPACGCHSPLRKTPGGTGADKDPAGLPGRGEGRRMNARRNGHARPDVATEVQERILAALAHGTVPWKRPWVPGQRPRSMSTGKPYHGINNMLLGMTEHQYGSPWWGTYRQIAELAGMVQVGFRWVSPDGTPRGVRKGEHGTQIVLYKAVTHHAKDDDDTDRPYLLARTYYVFNAEQADHLPARYYEVPGAADIEQLPEPQAVIDAWQATGKAAPIHHDVHDEAYYIPALDSVHLPPIGEHKCAADYYSTLFHEVVHSTGHKSRLDRWDEETGHQRFGSHAYGAEELTAEWGAALLQAETGIADQAEEQSAAYLASWIRTIKADKDLVMQAARRGQKAADLILAASEPQDEPVPDKGAVVLAA